MSRRDTRHFHQVLDNFWKVYIMIIAYLVAPYGITWERRRKKIFTILLKDSHHDRQKCPGVTRRMIFLGKNIVPVIDLKSRSYLEKSKFFIETWIFKNIYHLKLYPSSTKYLFRRMSRRDADDEFILKIIQFL